MPMVLKIRVLRWLLVNCADDCLKNGYQKSRSSAPVRSSANRRAVAWEGRRATARPREAKWSSVVASVFLMYYV